MRNMDSLCWRMLLFPSNCRFSPTMHPWLPGSAVWENGGERWRDGGGWGGERGAWEGVSCWKKPVDLSAGIFSPPPPSSKWEPQQGLLCLCSLFIYSCSPWKTFSLIPLLSVSPALSVWSLWRIAPLKDLLPHDQEVWIYLTAHVSVCVFAHV